MKTWILLNSTYFESDNESWILLFLNVKNVKLLSLKGKLPKNAGQIIKELLSDNNIVTHLKRMNLENYCKNLAGEKGSKKINLILALNI